MPKPDTLPPEPPTTRARPGRRPTQADRSAHTRGALLESAARGLSRYGYGNLVLDQVAKDAGYTRGALYHQFKDKQDLVMAVVDWVMLTWDEEVGQAVMSESNPVAALLTLVRNHAIYCRRDIARAASALRLEFSGQDHPVGHRIEQGYRDLVALCAHYISAGRAARTIPPGPPVEAVALAFVGALEGTTIALAGQAPDDELLAGRVAAGVLGLDLPAMTRHWRLTP